MALNAGVDILLHPTDPDNVVSYLENEGSGFRLQVSAKHTWGKEKRVQSIPDFEGNKQLSEKITRMAIKIDGRLNPLPFFAPLLIILSDDANEKGMTLYTVLKSRYRSLKYLHFRQGEDLKLGGVPRGRELIVAVFSSIRAWKGGASPWLLKCITELKGKAEIFVSFGSPYLIDRVGNNTTKIYAYWASEAAQKAVAEVIIKR